MALSDRSLPPARRHPLGESTDSELRGLLHHIEGRRRQSMQRLSAAQLTPGIDLRPAAARGAAGAPGSVRNLERITPDLIRFTVVRPRGFSYTAGGSVKLALGGISRTYSLVSAPHESVLEFFVELVPGGRMSAKLAALRSGARVDIGGKAKTGLTLDAKAKCHLMLATVTGVNPFVSLLRDAAQRGLRDLNCILVHGASYVDEFGYDDELRALADARPDLLTYAPTVSRPAEARNAGWPGLTGRAEAHIEAVCREHGLTPADTAAYACGHPGMIDEARARLGRMNYRVQAESYS